MSKRSILKLSSAVLALAIPLSQAKAQTLPTLQQIFGGAQTSPAAAPGGRHAHHARRDHAAHAMRHREVAVPKRLKTAHQARKGVDQVKQAEKEGFKKVSDLTNFPAFFPGLGIVMVKPDTLPIGPFRCFDRKGTLVASVYMPTLKDMEDHKTWDYVKGLPLPANHATLYFNAGHPGVPVPHYHVVIWHVSKEGEKLVAK